MPQFSMGQPTHQVSHCIGVLYYESSDVIVEAKLVEDEHDLQHHLVILLRQALKTFFTEPHATVHNCA